MFSLSVFAEGGAETVRVYSFVNSNVDTVVLSGIPFSSLTITSTANCQVAEEWSGNRCETMIFFPEGKKSFSISFMAFSVKERFTFDRTVFSANCESFSLKTGFDEEFSIEPQGYGLKVFVSGTGVEASVFVDNKAVTVLRDRESWVSAESPTPYLVSFYIDKNCKVLVSRVFVNGKLDCVTVGVSR